MALPIRPTSSGKPVPNKASLPSLDALPDLTTLNEKAPADKKEAPTKHRTGHIGSDPQAVKANPSPKLEDSDIPEGWARDPNTKKLYKIIGGYKPGVMKHQKQIIKSGGMTLSQLRASVPLEDSIDPDDMNSSAEMFLSHLRVPPDKEEQERLKEERRRRQQEYDKQYQRVKETEEEADEHLDSDI